MLFIGALILISSNRECKSSYVTFTFDDGYQEQYDTAFPILQEHNIQATIYVITDKIGKEFEGTTLMSLTDINSLQKAGWEIGSHTVTHTDLTKIPVSEIEKELENSKNFLLEKGFHINSVSIPYGKYNSQVLNLADKHYNTIRTSNKGYNYLPNLNKTNLKVQYVTNETNLDEMKLWVDYAKKDNTWLIVLIHLVRESKQSSYSEYGISSKDLEGLIEYVVSQNININTLSGVIDEYDQCRHK